MHLFAENVNPYLAKQLQQLNMNKVFSRGSGCELFDKDGNSYLDFIASYGALPFGFNPPEIWEAILQVKENGEPSFIQPSFLDAAGDLAGRLIELAPTGMKYVTFCNSGAEAVEAALKMARIRTGRPGIISTKNSFHGKTLGALSATGKELYQKGFGAPVPGFKQINFGDLEALETVLKGAPDTYAAFIVEPIQGEGGIIISPHGYLKTALEICHKYGTLLIIDEVQTGLGRTGRIFACESEGITPDIMTLAKALGGGIMPIGACLATEEAYSEDFALKHSSTFAGNTLACRVGIKVLEILTRDNGRILQEITVKGNYLLERLTKIQQKYPQVVKEVRGRGLMLGIEFGVTGESLPYSLLGVAADQELLSPVISSYLLNAERLRVAPTLNGAKVIRLEPPLIITEKQCEAAMDSIDRMTAHLANGNTTVLLAPLIGKKPMPVLPKRTLTKRKIEPPRPDEERFAFLVHPLSTANFSEFDESFAAFDAEDIRNLFRKIDGIIEPFVIGEGRVISKTGKTAYGEFISVPRTSEELMDLPKEIIFPELEKAVLLAKKRGAKIVGLGAYTSVVSKGGRDLRNLGVAITTGNSYTVAAAMEAAIEGATRLGISIPDSTAAVVGATGSIGRATTLLLAEQVKTLILIGNANNQEHSWRRLQKVMAEIYQHLNRANLPNGGGIVEFVKNHPLVPAPDADLDEYISFGEKVRDESPLLYTVDLEGNLPLADIVVTATSQVNSFITPDMLKFGSVVCDMARPLDVSMEVKEARPDVLVIDGGVVAVPGDPDFGWNFGFEKGLAYACMSETMMLALEGIYEHYSLGIDINIENIELFKNLALKHGFKLAGLRSFDRPMTEETWDNVVKARAKGINREAVNIS